ncbi:MAG: exonuclease SbcCD subunit D [Lachnospiraceae bacterium]|nr:exonuclease SbcCD subunit D [Lachnospiraceae bacterium]
MKFLHTSDLHIGKTVCGFSMLEEQRAVLAQMLEIVKTESIDMVFLSGDLYDRALPPSQAVTVLDDFLTSLIDLGVVVCGIAGNHDSGERIGFANRILEHRGLYLEGVLNEKIRCVDWTAQIGEAGAVRVHLLPYAKPAQVRDLFHKPVVTYEEAMQELLRHVDYLENGKNILLTHQFVVNHGLEPELSDSETRASVGGADQVEAANFTGFDYVALGHIHGPQKIGEGPVYYSGSPVKYSFSEVHQKKSVLVGSWDEQGALQIKRIPLKPVHDMRKIRGKLADLIAPAVVEAADCEDYLMAILTNEEDLADPIGTLRSVYPNVMQLQLEQVQKERQEQALQRGLDWKEKSPTELFSQFYEYVMDQDLTEEQAELIEEVITQAKEGQA